MIGSPQERELLNKFTSGEMTESERDVFIGVLKEIQDDTSRWLGERMAAAVLRASLIARSVHA